MATTTGAIKNLINIKTIIDGFIIDENDHPTAIYEVKGGINSLTAAEQAITNAFDGLKQAFNTLKQNEEVQIILNGQQYNPDPLILKYNDLVDKSHVVPEYANFYPNYLDDYLSTYCRENKVLDYKFYVLFTYKEPDIIIKNLFMQKKKTVKKDVVAMRRDISQRSRGFIGALKQMGLEVIDLNRQEVLNVLDKALNPTQTAQTPIAKMDNSFNEFKGILARTPLKETSDKIMLGKEYIKTMYISDIPNIPGVIQNLFFKYSYFTLTIFAKGISQQDQKDELKQKLKTSIGTGGGRTDIENREIASSVTELLVMHTRGDVKFIKFACYLSFKSDSLEKLEEITPEIESVLQDGIPFSGIYEQKTLWSSTLPFCRNQAEHWFLTLTGNAGSISAGLSNLFPFFNFEVDNSEGGVLLGTSATNQPVLLNPWSKKLINGNHVILGQPGSGKSFYVNLILNRLSPWKTEIIIIDKSKSYEILCECNKGQYIKIGLNGENAYNVFDCIDYEEALGEENDINIKGEPTAGKISFITGLFDIILSEEGEKRLNKLDSSLVEEIIVQTYKENIKVSPSGKVIVESVPHLGSVIDTIENMLKDKKNFEWKGELSRISQKLGPFVGTGTYAALLDNKSNMSLNSSFIVFDISGLPDRDDIQSLAVYIISSFAMQRFKINKKLGKKQILCVDEAWYLARFTGGRAFLLELAKRSRHLGLMVLMATQQINDFLGQPEAAQFLKSAVTKTIFKQSSTDLPLLQSLLELNARETDILSGLFQERGRFSQAFYISGDIKNTIYIRPDAVLRWIATSEPTFDVPARNKAIEESNGNIWQAITKLVSKGA
jgi:type IV secretory pathway VirB4 component